MIQPKPTFLCNRPKELPTKEDPIPRVVKLWPTCQIRHAACVCKERLTGTQPCLCTVYGCCHTATAELNICDIDGMGSVVHFRSRCNTSGRERIMAPVGRGTDVRVSWCGSHADSVDA